jgi:hypothetical protein
MTPAGRGQRTDSGPIGIPAVAARRRFVMSCDGVFARVSHDFLQRDARPSDWSRGQRRPRFCRISGTEGFVAGCVNKSKEIA